MSIAGKKIFWVFLFFLVALPEAWPVEKGPIRVRLFSRHEVPQVQIDDLHLSASGTQNFPQRILPREGVPLRLRLANGVTRRLNYPLLVRKRGGRLEIFAELPLEKYVTAVLASELPGNFPMESLKAQAVIIRTLALKGEPRHAQEGFDFCDSTHCQLFLPPEKVPAIFEAAARQTQGMVLTFRGSLIAGLYHSSCGGHTSPNHRVFGGKPLPYLRGVNDGTFCSDSPHHRWKAEISREELRKVFQENSPMMQIHPLDRDGGGRIFLLETYAPQRQTWSAQEFLLRLGRSLGWNKIKSALFQVEISGDFFTFSGRGLGHGVGLCQWGARGMALQGHDYRKILQHYFPGTQVRRMSL
ncbi:MAG: SpoIID/LytB domain-containing protein [bacterium]|nr:SpoIID/LytB domain-containing protein [bacterium]